MDHATTLGSYTLHLRGRSQSIPRNVITRYCRVSICTGDPTSSRRKIANNSVVLKCYGQDICTTNICPTAITITDKIICNCIVRNQTIGRIK